MYEFSSKKDREEFKKTSYGKKTNLWLILAIAISVPILLLIFAILFFVDISELSTGFLKVIQILIMVSIAIIGYFDGKRDGAIEQFKSSKKDVK